MRTLLPGLFLLLLGALVSQGARADTVPYSGNFTADNSYFSYSFTTTSAQVYTFATSSYATNGFVPVLTLFNSMSGSEIDNFGSGVSDASITDTLSAGRYVLYLTEFPNVAIGNLSDGFLFANAPNITGTDCSVAGGKFLDDITCQQRTSSYALTVTSTPAATAVTPEPATFVLVLPAMLLLLGFSKRLGARDFSFPQA